MKRLKQLIVCWNQNVGSRLSILLAASLVTGAILALLVPALEPFLAGRYTVGFKDGYDLIANNLANGNGYRWSANMGETMIREPGYPLFLAGIFKLAGYHIEAIRCANWLLAFGVALMMIPLTRIVTGNGNAAPVAIILFLLHPGTLLAEARGGVELLFIFASFAFMLALHQAVNKNSSCRYFVAGLLLGAVVQVRSTPLVFPVFLLFYLVLTANGKRERLTAVLNVAILALGMALVMTPWVIRNYRLVHEFVPTSTIVGLNLQEGQYTCQHLSLGGDFYAEERAAGLIRGHLASALGLRFEGLEYSQVFYDARDEWIFTNKLIKNGQQEYFRRPGLLAVCGGKNLFNFWFLGKTWKVTELNMLIQAPLLIFVLSGLHLLWKRGILTNAGIMLTFVMSILVVHLPLVAEARHSIPVLALLAIPASVSITSIWHNYRTRNQVTVTTAPFQRH
jgi:4-amino-4-deoxy-L-arabinose transferase-like glycosyltransferase